MDNNRQKPSSIIVFDEISIKKFKSNVIIHFYFLAYGIALIICGINVFFSHEQYQINHM